MCFATSGSFPQCKWHFHVRLDHVFQLHFGRKSRRIASLCRCSTCILEGSLVQSACLRESGSTKCCVFQYKGWLRTWPVKLLRNDGFRTVSRHVWIMFGSCSNRPSIVTRVFTCFFRVLMEFHCVLQLLDGFRTVNVTASVSGG